MSTRGVPKTENRLFKVSWGIPRSVGLGLLIRDSAYAVIFLALERWVGMRRITNWSRRLNSFKVLLNREMEWVSPYLRMQATAVLLSQYTRTVWLHHWGPHWSTANLMASSSIQLMCWDHYPERWRVCQLAPHPVRDAFVKKIRLGFRRCRGTPWRTSRLLNQQSCVRNSASSWIRVSCDCLCCDQCLFIQNCRNLRWRCPWWIKGAKCKIRLVMEDILRAGMTVDVDRWDRTLVREFKNESGGETMACLRLKSVPRSLECMRILAETSSNW